MTYVDQTRRPDDSARSELLDGRAADRVLLDEFFSGVDLAWIRADCAIALRDTRLDSDRAALLVAAIDEGLANAVRHGGGEGRLVLLYDGGEVVAHISDRGPGIAGTIPEQLPPPDALGGRGLWMSRQMVDRLILTSGPRGTVLRLEVVDSASGPAVPVSERTD
jgi:anti-sigma regulatory factor (Ser/Thr protein kinase)